MKKKLTTTDFIGIIGIIAMFAVPCFTIEIRTILMEKWQIIMFCLGIGLLVLKITHIWIRWAKEDNAEKLNKLDSELKESLKNVRIELENTSNKLKALKKYRDIEFVRMLNQYNHNFKQLVGEDNWNLPITNKNEIENLRFHNKHIDEYNKAFEDWELGNFALDEHLTSIDKPKFKQ